MGGETTSNVSPLFGLEDKDVDFDEYARRIPRRGGTPPITDTSSTLCFDPGHTTGWALFIGLSLAESGEIDTRSIEQAAAQIGYLMGDYSPDTVVLEDYRVYKWRAKHHAGSNLLTARVIGSIETLAVIHSVGIIIKQPAHIAKGFCSDKKLREWGMYVKGEKHARDAIRHGCYFLLFGAIKQKDRQVGPTVG